MLFSYASNVPERSSTEFEGLTHHHMNLNQNHTYYYSSSYSRVLLWFPHSQEDLCIPKFRGNFFSKKCREIFQVTEEKRIRSVGKDAKFE